MSDLKAAVLLALLSMAAAHSAFAQQATSLDEIQVPNGIPMGPALATLPPGVLDALWCFDDRFRRNNRIMDKSKRPPSVCGPAIAQMPWVALLKERDLAKYAMAAICHGSAINIAGIPVGTVSAIQALSTCQCHNPGNAAKIAANWPQVESAFRQYGNCAR